MRLLPLLLAAMALAPPDAFAAGAKPRRIAAFPLNLAYVEVAVPERQRDPVEKFWVIFSRITYDRRDDLQPAFAQMDAEIDSEIEQRRQQGLELAKDAEKRLRSARAELEGSLTALRNTSEENWTSALQNTRLRLQELRAAYAATKAP